jgi:CheY-like chemotaxis protein
MLKLEPKLWPVHADPSQLEASLINIVNNARDAMPNGGLVTITTTNKALDEDYTATQADLEPGDYAMVEVSDSGTGIPPDLVDKIFDPFFTTKEQGKGTGLGLSMVFGFVKQSAGHISVYSELGHGTTFRLYLPRSKAATDKQKKPETPVRGGHETILVVEDNDNLRRVVVRQLKDLGYILLEAENGPAALKVLRYEHVDLLFTDIMMPGGMSGYELAQNALAGKPALKVLLTSGFPDTRLDSNREASAKLQLLTKPYRKDDLSRAIRQLIDTG